MSDVAPYGTPVIPPPSLEKGEKVIVTNLSYKVTEGKWGFQYEFNGELENGYKVRAWVKKYDKPSTATKLYKLCALIDKQHGHYSDTIEEALNRLIFNNRLYFECTGHREYKELQYPKFAVYDEEVPEPPTIQKKIDSPASRADKVIAHILKERPDLTGERVDSLVAEELKNSGGVFGEDTAAVLVARTLGVDLETTGTKVI